MLGRLVNRHLASVPPEHPWGDTLSVLRSADALIVNLECVISNRGEPWPGKIFTFRSDLKNVAVLTAAGVTAVSLANNHSMDYGGGARGLHRRSGPTRNQADRSRFVTERTMVLAICGGDALMVMGPCPLSQDAAEPLAGTAASNCTTLPGATEPVSAAGHASCPPAVRTSGRQRRAGGTLRRSATGGVGAHRQRSRRPVRRMWRECSACRGRSSRLPTSPTSRRERRA